jgi:hypothetical protein
MRYTILLAALVLSLPQAALAQAQRHNHGPREDNWMENCRDRDGDRGTRGRHCEERAMGWRAGSGELIAVDAGPNGGVSVSGWDRDSVHVIVKISARAGSDEEARDLAGQIRIERDGGELSAEGPASRRYASWQVSYEIYAPARSDLRLSTMNGPVQVEDVTGRMDLDVHNGPLSLQHLGGEVRARAQNGPLHVELMGTRWDGVGLDASTQNGPVVLEVPEGYNAELETGTVNGPMEFGFPVTVQGRFGGRNRRLTTRLGSGGPQIRAVTTNGPAVLRRI